MRPVAFTGHQLTLAIAVNIHPLHVVILRAEWIDRVMHPAATLPLAPPEPVPMAVAGYNFIPPIAIYVDNQHRHTRRRAPRRLGKILVPNPLAVECIGRGFQPAAGEYDIFAAIAGNVAAAQAVALNLFFGELKQDMFRELSGPLPRFIAL